MTAALIGDYPRAAYTDEPIFRLTVDQYHQLIESGTLTADDPVELVEGILVYKMPKKTPHATSTRLCRRAIEAVLPAGCFYDSQEPITLDDGEPEPDGMIVRGRPEDFAEKHIGPEDLSLVIEVADSSLGRDRGMKMRSYARAGIGCYWIINLNDRRVEIYSDPDRESASFRDRKVAAGDEGISIVVAGAVVGTIRADELFAVIVTHQSGLRHLVSGE